MSKTTQQSHEAWQKWTHETRHLPDIKEAFIAGFSAGEKHAASNPARVIRTSEDPLTIIRLKEERDSALKQAIDSAGFFELIAGGAVMIPYLFGGSIYWTWHFDDVRLGKWVVEDDDPVVATRLALLKHREFKVKNE